MTLVLGGTRSGKSEIAELLAARTGTDVTYVATAADEDANFRERVSAHRARRPAAWQTIESGADLPSTIEHLHGTVVVDSLGAWIARTLEEPPDVDRLCRALAARTGDTVVVSEEVGLGVHPPTTVGMRFADALGECNRRVAAVADHVLLVVAGRTLDLHSLQDL
jgi:adenosyl cobinamide kinase/adenosyl cobinamide phosphate guanylyltransferase